MKNSINNNNNSLQYKIYLHTIEKKIKINRTISFVQEHYQKTNLIYIPMDFQDHLESTLSEVLTARQFAFPRRNDCKRKRQNKKRGPGISTVKVKLYHLPAASENPRYKKYDGSVVQRHFMNGYEL